MDQLNVKGKELLVRKKMASFLERLLQYWGYDLRHDTFKQIMYGELCVNTESEQTIKNYYDAYVYLLNNANNTFTQEVFGKFLFLICGKPANSALLIRITTLFYNLSNLAPLEFVTEFHLCAFKEMIELPEQQRNVVSLLLLNYTLVKNGIPTINLCKDQFRKYYDRREKWLNGDTFAMHLFIQDIIKNAKFQDKSYYANLRLLSASEVVTQIKHDEELLKTRYGVKHIILYGSFSKGTQRIDSDIDIFVNFSFDLTSEQKQKCIDDISKFYFNIFNRYMDINEIGEYLLDNILKEMTKHKKIF